MMNNWSPTATQLCLSSPSSPPHRPPSPSWSSTSLGWLISTTAGLPLPPLISLHLAPLVQSCTEAFLHLVKVMVPLSPFQPLRAAVHPPPCQGAASLPVSHCWGTLLESASALLGKKPPGTQSTWVTFLQQPERT